MSDTAFTPGSWCWEQCGEKHDDPVVGIAYRYDDTDCKNPLSGRLPECDGNGEPIEYYRETIAREIMSCDGCSASANAALIAAAPALYALVRESLYHLRLDDGAKAYHDRALAALALARGEQSS